MEKRGGGAGIGSIGRRFVAKAAASEGPPLIRGK